MKHVEHTDEHSEYYFDHLIALSNIYTRSRFDFHPISRCVAIDPHTDHIFVAYDKERSVHVNIFSQSGELLNSLLIKINSYIYCIAIYQDTIYMTCAQKPLLRRFTLSDGIHLSSSIRDEAPGIIKCDSPKQLCISIYGDIFVTYPKHNRVVIFDGDLCYKRGISHYSMKMPCDIKLSTDEVFVLCSNILHGCYCIHVFTHMGNKLRTILLHEVEKNRLGYNAFNSKFRLDTFGNIIISDTMTEQVKFFTKEGKLFYTLGEKDDKLRILNSMNGLALTSNNKLVVLTNNLDFDLQIYSCSQYS